MKDYEGVLFWNPAKTLYIAHWKTNPGVWMTMLLCDLEDQHDYAVWCRDRGLPLYLQRHANEDVSILVLMGLIFGDDMAMEWRMRWT
ncbi:MAG: hypothetical protein EOP83_14820 [Verrucomicrobiaceae bacterium]|nr:MAG: hypothetical protein EOP83_14820 [Verrucomicrobiaceae bacterium]